MLISYNNMITYDVVLTNLEGMHVSSWYGIVTSVVDTIMK